VIGVATSDLPKGEVPAGITYRVVDVTDAPRFRAICREITAAHERLDIYIHAAGVSLPDAGPEDTLRRFVRTVEVNLTAAFTCCLAAAEAMDPTYGGSIVLITSINARLGFPHNPGYVASKAGLAGLTRALALDLGERNVRVNAIAPGYIRTAMTEASYRDPTRRSARLHRTILKRWGIPEDLVGAAIFLASDASAYVTGQELVVDGGWTAKGL
jgi:gluconate 5-dehydrogenase